MGGGGVKGEVVHGWVFGMLTVIPAAAAGPWSSTVCTYTGPRPRMMKPNPTASLVT